MSIAQIVLTIIFYIWLFLVVGLLAYHARRSGTYVRGLQHTLTEIALQSVNAATVSADAAKQSAETVTKLVALMEQEKRDARSQ